MRKLMFPLFVMVLLLFMLFPRSVFGYVEGVEVVDGLMDSAWPMKCHDTRHTSQSPFSTVGNTGRVLWKYKTTEGIEGGVVIDNDGVLYFGDFQGYLYAVYPNGTLKWKSDYIGNIWSTPALAQDGTIYIGSYSNRLYAFNPNGTLKWKFGAKDTIVTSPAIADDGTIYIGTMGFPDSGGCRVYAIYPNGTEKWHYQTGYKIASDPAIGEDGTIYIGSGDTYLYAINPNGTLKWRFKTGDWVKSHPSITEEGIIHFDSFDGYSYALYPNGALWWKQKISSSGVSSTAIADDGTIYIAGRKLTALYPNGTIKWTLPFGEKIICGHGSPAISAEGTIYVPIWNEDMCGGWLLAVSSNGTELWRKKIANLWVESSPCIGSDGTVYVGSSWEDPGGNSYGYLYALGESGVNHPPDKPTINGETLGRVNTEYTYTVVTVDPDEDEIYYFVDWGDNTSSGWLGPYVSGKQVKLTHSWSERGGYDIRVKAKDALGAESSWATLTIIMPRSTLLQNMCIPRFVQHLPKPCFLTKYSPPLFIR